VLDVVSDSSGRPKNLFDGTALVIELKDELAGGVVGQKAGRGHHEVDEPAISIDVPDADGFQRSREAVSIHLFSVGEGAGLNELVQRVFVAKELDCHTALGLHIREDEPSRQDAGYNATGKKGQNESKGSRGHWPISNTCGLSSGRVSGEEDRHSTREAEFETYEVKAGSPDALDGLLGQRFRVAAR
jgi:hypothetical protein